MSYCILILFSLIVASCNGNIENKFNTNHFEESEYVAEPLAPIVPAAERLQLYLPDLKNKRVGIVVNHTSRVGKTHLVDSLLSLEIDIEKIFAPEHGFKGSADAGEKVQDGMYKNIPVISLYGKNRKPSNGQMLDLDIIVFDIQDVGVRFYTYISTMTYVLDAAAENNVPVIILDRPNPNGFYVDGPVLESEFSSFVGLHEVPVVYGMTIGEYASMVKGESWLESKIDLNLKVIPCNNYDHTMTYDLPIKPSPNLPNLRSVLLYPSLCFFEGTTMSIGRGTNKQFQLIGHPAIQKTKFVFTPKPGEGSANPKLNGQVCNGQDLSGLSPEQIKMKGEIVLHYVLKYYQQMNAASEDFFLENNFFNKLAGSESLKKSIINGKSEKEIRNTWSEKINQFKEIRKKYLLYKDFE